MHVEADRGGRLANPHLGWQRYVAVGSVTSSGRSTHNRPLSATLEPPEIGHWFTAVVFSGMHTYVRDKALTLAGLRGSRPAQLIERLGATHQAAEDVRHLLPTGNVA